MGICYIVGAGDFYGEINPNDDDLVIAADGGYRALISHGVRCDLLIGDLDSLCEAPSGVNLIRFPCEKDDTDSFLAYRQGKKRGYTDFRLYGCTGGREDHTFANYSLLLYAAREGNRAILFGDEWLSFVLSDGRVTLIGKEKDCFSVFAIGGDAGGVSISNAKYEVNGANLSPDFPLGVSNSFTGAEAKISVKSGSLLIISYGDGLPRLD